MSTLLAAPPAPGTPGTLLLRPADAAKLLAVSTRTLWSITAPRGPVPCVRVGPGGGAVRYSLAALRQWIDGAAVAQ